LGDPELVSIFEKVAGDARIGEIICRSLRFKKSIGGIDHGKGGGGAVDKINAAHIDGSGKPGKVAHHAAAHGHHKVAAPHAEVQHLPQHSFQNFKALAGFALPARVMMVASLHWSATICAYCAGTPLSVTTATRRSSRANWYRFSSEPRLTMMS